MAVQTEKSVRVHRFYDAVAIDTESGSTVYLTKELAEKFAQAILNCSRDIGKQPKFSLSNFNTVDIKEK